MYDLKQIREPTLDLCTSTYINDKLIPMWPAGWMKAGDFQSAWHKSKEKDTKRLSSCATLSSSSSSSSTDHKTSKSHYTAATALTPQSSAHPMIVDNFKESAMIPMNADKKKSHTMKSSSTKLMKNVNDKPTLPTKTDKKHAHSTTDRSQLLSMPLNDLTSMPTSKPVRNHFYLSITES